MQRKASVMLTGQQVMLQGPVVYGGKLENRYKQSDKLKVVLATATLMNKPEQHTRKDQAWNHSAEVRFKALEDDKMLVSLAPVTAALHNPCKL